MQNDFFLRKIEEQIGSHMERIELFAVSEFLYGQKGKGTLPELGKYQLGRANKTI